MAPVIQAVRGHPRPLSCPVCGERGSVSRRRRAAPEAVSPRTSGAVFLRGDDRGVPWEALRDGARDQGAGTGSSAGQGGPALGPSSVPGVILFTCSPTPQGQKDAPAGDLSVLPLCSAASSLPEGSSSHQVRGSWAHGFAAKLRANSQGLGPLSMAAGSLLPVLSLPHASHRPPSCTLNTLTCSTSRPLLPPGGWASVPGINPFSRQRPHSKALP